jgi:hypothetical protein
MMKTQDMSGRELTNIGVRYDESSSKKGKKDALNVFINVPKQSPI